MTEPRRERLLTRAILIALASWLIVLALVSIAFARLPVPGDAAILAQALPAPTPIATPLLAGNGAQGHSAALSVVKDWITVIGSAGSLVALLLLLWLQTKFVSNERFTKSEIAIDEVRKEIDRMEGRISKIETTVEHFPDREVTHALRVSVTELKGEMKVLTEQLKPVASIADRLQEFLLDQARR